MKGIVITVNTVGSVGVAPLILYLGTRRWVVSYTPRPLYPCGGTPFPIE